MTIKEENEMLKAKTLQKTRITFALLIAISCIGGLLGLFYPLKIFNINIAPLIQSTITSFTILSGILIILLIAITLLFGRIYCSTICPLGLLQELYLLIFHRKKHPTQKNSPLKYFIAALTLGTLLGGTAYLMRLIDPYSIFGSAVSGATYGLTLIAVIALLTWFKGRYFCTNICPVGTILGIIAKHSLYKITINKDACVACGLCAQKCPADCIDYKNKSVDNETCIKCFRCLSLCHNSGISFEKEKEKKQRTNPPINTGRRRFLLSAGALAVLAIAYKSSVKLSENVVKKLKSILLPPGAGDSKTFANKCLNCNLCVANCPMKIIQKADEEFPVVHLKYQKSFCDYNCHKCSEVCPSGAIKKLTLKEKQHTQIGLASVNIDSCIQCGLCVMECPRSAITKEQGDFPQIDTEKCIGCGACQAVCPVSAIKVNTTEFQKTLKQ